MSLSITCWGLAAVLCLFKSFVYVPHFGFTSHLLAEQLIRVVSWPDSLCPTNAFHGRGFGTHQIDFGRRGTLCRQTADIGLVCLGLYPRSAQEFFRIIHSEVLTNPMQEFLFVFVSFMSCIC